MNTDPTITCPNCSEEIKLTESLAAPLVKSVREEYERKIREEEKPRSRVSKREADVREKLKAVAKAQETIDDQVSEKLGSERKAIAAEQNESQSPA